MFTVRQNAQVMLLSDGSVTRHLELLTGLAVTVVRARVRCRRRTISLPALLRRRDVFQAALASGARVSLDARGHGANANRMRACFGLAVACCGRAVVQPRRDGAPEHVRSLMPPVTRLSRSPQDCLEMQRLEADAANAEPPVLAAAPPATRLLQPPRLRRQVVLHGGQVDGARRALPRLAGGTAKRLHSAGTPLVYAASWWNCADAERHLADTTRPIWASLAASRTDVFRELRCVLHGRNRALEAALGVRGPFWAREYVFWHGGVPLTAIHEAFSPELGAYLGECEPRGSDAGTQPTLRWHLRER